MEGEGSYGVHGHKIWGGGGRRGRDVESGGDSEVGGNGMRSNGAGLKPKRKAADGDRGARGEKAERKKKQAKHSA